MTKFLQRVSRIILAVFALILLFTGGMSFQRYLTEHKAPKTVVTAQVIKVDNRKKVAYDYHGVHYKSVPVANVIQNFGKEGYKITVYVNKHDPKKIYMKPTVTVLLILASVMIGWAVLIILVLGFEYWLIHKVKEIAHNSDMAMSEQEKGAK